MNSYDKRRKANGRKHGTPWNKGVTMSLCMDCDGCGWCEGSPAFKCNTCNGRGKCWPPRVRMVSPRVSTCSPRLVHNHSGNVKPLGFFVGTDFIDSLASTIANELGAAEMLSGPTADAERLIEKVVGELRRGTNQTHKMIVEETALRIVEGAMPIIARFVQDANAVKVSNR